MQVKTIEIITADEGMALHQINTDIYCSSVMLRVGQNKDEFEEVPLSEVPQPEEPEKPKVE